MFDASREQSAKILFITSTGAYPASPKRQAHREATSGRLRRSLPSTQNQFLFPLSPENPGAAGVGSRFHAPNGFSSRGFKRCPLIVSVNHHRRIGRKLILLPNFFFQIIS